MAAEGDADVIELAGIGGGEVRRPAGAIVDEFNGDFKQIQVRVAG